MKAKNRKFRHAIAVKDLFIASDHFQQVKGTEDEQEGREELIKAAIELGIAILESQKTKPGVIS